MKKLIALIMCLTIIAMAALPAAAQTRSRYRYDRRSERRAERVYRTNQYYDYQSNDYRYGRERSVWDKHRDKITTAGGAAGGAVLGGLIGGKKGAIIGAITGGAGAAIYTYKIRDKNRRY